MNKTFTYRFSDGSEIQREATRETMEEIAQYEIDHGVKLIYNGFRDQIDSLQPPLRANSHKRKTDGFQPGWNPALGKEIRTHGQFQAELKAKGLVEVGRDKQTDYKPKETKIFDKEMISEIKERGADLSDSQCESLMAIE